MTFAELILKVAEQKGSAPVFTGIGRFVVKPVRSSGRKTDGTQWTNPGRTKLALSPSVHVGGLRAGGKKKTTAPAPVSDTASAA